MLSSKSNINETQIGNNLLQSFDFTPIDEMDPSLGDAYKLLFDREIQFHIKFDDGNSDSQDLSTDEPLRIRIFQNGDNHNPQELKIEVSSENDIFFHYVHMVNERNFYDIKEKQQLQIDFKEYPSICIQSFNRCQKDQDQYCGVFIIQSDGKGRMSILQITEYKNIELISFDFDISPEEVVRQQITYRYGSTKSKLSLMESRLQDINELLRLKNPSLLLQLQKQTIPNKTPKK